MPAEYQVLQDSAFKIEILKWVDILDNDQR